MDVETTGLSARQDRIIELAILRTDADLRVVDQWVCRFHPGQPVTATHIHGITDADLAGAPPFGALIEQINARLAGAAIIAHNARFDLAFLRAEYARAGWQLPYLPALCTYELAYTRHLTHLPRHRLADCAAALGLNLHAPHNALHDAHGAHGLARAFLDPGRGVPPLPGELRLPEDASLIAWPSAPTSAPLPDSQTVPELHPARVLSDQARRNIAKQEAARQAPALRTLLDQVRLADALDDGAPEGSLPYLALLAEALEDGVLTPAEQDALRDLATAYDLGQAEVTDAHRGFVLALAHLALDDGKVTREEKAELALVSELLDVDKKVLDAQVKLADTAREARLGAGLSPLPDTWPHGEPLRVGDRVAFTGCDPDERERLETRAERLGVRVMGNVSGRTAMLVTDGSFTGTKADDAAAIGTRLVEPAVFAVLLQHLQPALPRAERATPKPSAPRTPTGPAVSIHGAESPAPSPDSTMSGEADPATVRAWARAEGLPVGERGRIDSTVRDAYRAAHQPGIDPAGTDQGDTDHAGPAAASTAPATTSTAGAAPSSATRPVPTPADIPTPGPVPEPPVPEPQLPPPNWYPDPSGRFEHRFWDGSAWTNHVGSHGKQGLDQ